MPAVSMLSKTFVADVAHEVINAPAGPLGAWHETETLTGHTVYRSGPSSWVLIGADDETSADNWAAISEWLQSVTGCTSLDVVDQESHWSAADDEALVTHLRAAA